MKILWMSDSPTSPSGFGNVTRFVCAALANCGDQVSILGWQARGEPVSWQNCTLYPVRHDSFGADVLLNYLCRLQPDVLVTLADIWWLTFISHPLIANFMRTAAIPWALYYPIDSDLGDGRLPPSWVHILKTVDLPIAMSQYGRDVSRINGVQPAYIPHGVETNVFKPPEDKAAAKRALGYEDKFVILSDARNQPRKQLPRLLEIFRRFSAGKDDVLLHLHCDPNDPAARTPEYFYDLKSDIAFLGLQEKVRVTDGMTIAEGLPLDRLAAIYQAADVHLLASLGEGFGLPTLQAASAGVVPMASDYTASRELTLGHGEAIGVKHYLQDQFGLRRALIDIDDAVGKLERLYRDRDLLCAKSEAARRFAESYDWAQLAPQWRELLQREVPRLRNALRYPGTTSSVTVGQRRAGGSSELAATVRSALPPPTENVRITVNVVESKAGQLTAEVFRDAQAFERTLTIPVTLPPVDLNLAKRRVTGCVYIVSARNAAVAQTLSRIFSDLKIWSPTALDLGHDPVTGETIRSKAVPRESPAFRHYLSASTLAIDLDGADPSLAAQAAELGVPCVGVARQSQQARLWPELTPESGDQAPELCRWMLTDQGMAAEICERARRRLTEPMTVTA